MTSHRSPQSRSNPDERTLAEEAEEAVRAELRGNRLGILGALGEAGPAPLSRNRSVPDRWSFLHVMERMEEGFRVLSRLPMPTRPRGFTNSMPVYLYDRGDLNAQLETHELERMARMRNYVRIRPSPAEIDRMEEALHWPSAYLAGQEFSHLARAVNLAALWAAFDADVDNAVKRIKIARRTFNARMLQGYLHLAPQVTQIVQAGAPVLAAIEQVEPAVLPLLEKLAGQVFPQLDAQAAKTVIAKAAFAPQSWTPQEQQLWWDRASDQE